MCASITSRRWRAPRGCDPKKRGMVHGMNSHALRKWAHTVTITPTHIGWVPLGICGRVCGSLYNMGHVSCVATWSPGAAGGYRKRPNALEPAGWNIVQNEWHWGYVWGYSHFRVPLRLLAVNWRRAFSIVLFSPSKQSLSLSCLWHWHRHAACTALINTLNSGFSAEKLI